MRNFLVNAGRVGQGIDRAAQTRSAAEIARIQAAQAQDQLAEQRRLAQETAATRAGLLEFQQGMTPEEFEAVLNRQPMDQRVGQGQQPQEQEAPRRSAGVQTTADPNVEYDFSPDASPSAPATPPIQPDRQPRSARERDAAAQPAQPEPEAQPRANLEDGPTVSYSPGHMAPPGGTLSARGAWQLEIEDGQRRHAQMHGVDPDEYIARMRRDPSDARAWLEQNSNNPDALTEAFGLGLAARESRNALFAGARQGLLNIGDHIRGAFGAAQGEPAIGVTPEPELERIASRQAGLTAPETEETPTPDTVEAHETELVENPTPQRVKQVVEKDTTPSGTKTNKVPENTAKYLANPQHITPDMQHVLRQRELTSLLTSHHIRTNNFEVAGQLMLGMMDMDQSLFVLQGMQGVNEAMNAGDTRRLSSVLSHFNGTNVEVVPHTDGTFHIEQDGQVAMANLTGDQLATVSSQVFSPAAREAATQAQADMRERMLDFEFWTQEQMVELQRDLYLASHQGNIDGMLQSLAQRYEDHGVISLHNTPMGDVIARFRRPDGSVGAARFNPREEPTRQGIASRFFGWFTDGAEQDPPLDDHLSSIGLNPNLYQ